MNRLGTPWASTFTPGLIVDEIVSDSVELARRVRRDAKRVAGAVRDAVAEPERIAIAADLRAEVLAWNAVVLNRAADCSRCRARIERGESGYLGVSDPPTAARTWLCASCREQL